MLTLTPTAVAAVSMLLQDPQVPDSAGLRLQGGVGPDGEPAVGIVVVNGPTPGDERVPAATQGAVFLAREVADVLDECVLDAEIEGENVAFTIHPQPLNGTGPG
jgi:hypothetical protein